MGVSSNGYVQNFQRTNHQRFCLEICQLNRSSFLPKLSFLENVMLTELDSDIICFSETWLEQHSTIDSHLKIMGYTHFHCYRINCMHGGLLVYVCSYLPAVGRTDLECSTIECIALNVTI